MTTAVQARGGDGALDRSKSSGLAEVVDTILDKGLVIDAYVGVSLGGEMPVRTNEGGARTAPRSGWYVYGIVGRDVEVLPDARGVGDPPAPVELVLSDDVEALVSEIQVDQPLGSTADLMAHEELLDATVVTAPVLPIRFGAVMESREDVAHELLEPHGLEFADALDSLEGEAQYVLHARYVEEVLVGEVLRADRTAAALAERLADEPSESTRDIQLQLGELINDVVERRRREDTEAVVEAVTSLGALTAVRPPTHEEDAAHVAMLVPMDRESDVDTALGSLADEWDGRVSAKLTGPMAPYDFVIATREGE
jgi:hypothetical protein